jgi:hypothetical protein
MSKRPYPPRHNHAYERRRLDILLLSANLIPQFKNMVYHTPNKATTFSQFYRATFTNQAMTFSPMVGWHIEPRVIAVTDSEQRLFPATQFNRDD